MSRELCMVRTPMGLKCLWTQSTSHADSVEPQGYVLAEISVSRVSRHPSLLGATMTMAEQSCEYQWELDRFA